MIVAGMRENSRGLRCAANLDTLCPLCVDERGAGLGNLSIAMCGSANSDAADALSAATARLREKDYEDIVTLDGNYVRRTAAELFARPAVGRA